MTFKSVIAWCVVILLVSFFVLDFAKLYTRYEFLVKGEVCIALDRKEDTLKFISVNGSVSIPLTKTVEDRMRDKIESEITEKIQNELTATRQNNFSSNTMNNGTMGGNMVNGMTNGMANGRMNNGVNGMANGM